MKFDISERGRVLASIEAKCMFMKDIKTKQLKGGNLEELRTKISIGKFQENTLDEDGLLNHKGRICVPRVDDLIPRLFVKSHVSRYYIHLGVTKMYRALKRIYWL